MNTIQFIPNRFSRRIPYSYAKQHQICIYGIKNDTILIASINTPNHHVISELKRKLNAPIEITLCELKNFNQLLSEAYSSNNAASVVGDMQDDINLSELIHNLPKSEDLLESQNDAPVIKIINAFLTQAVKEEASDIHLDAYERQSVVRYRKDGVLHNIVDLNPGLHAALVSRIKIMAHLDIAEKRLPQDGRIPLRLAGREIDLRISTIPTGHGERVVMRLLDKSKDRLKLESLGMRSDTIHNIDKLIKMPYGIFLVTGPTGSGKSTTLYSALSRLDNTNLNIMTVEDPIEYDITGISQTQVNQKIDMTFSRALRAILRQDPDVIMIGEIRDLDTTQIAVQASLTGHLVLATLHTNTATAAITRLLDMGVESFLLSSTLIGVLSQRLIRLLCRHCKTQNLTITNEIKKQYQIPLNTTIYRAVGCNKCNNTGYLGRTGVHELLIIDNNIKKMIHANKSETEIEQYAIESKNLTTLKMNAIRYLLEGTTSIEEIIAVTKEENL